MRILRRCNEAAQERMRCEKGESGSRLSFYVNGKASEHGDKKDRGIYYP